jgi:retron-type reverse transcriptase
LEDNKLQITNYRPVSLLTGFSKIFEMLIFSRLKQHLISHNILVSELYGFRDGVSIENAIFTLTELIFKAWNKKELITGLFCDLTQAFDCVDHELLIQKLDYYGVKGSILKWLESYLYNRKQRPVLQLINSTEYLSEWETIRFGVPQGSVLSPLLFNVYINDFPCIIHKDAHTILYADDTNILVSANDQNEINSKLNLVNV